MEEWLKKHWLWIAGGGLAILVILYFSGGRSGSSAGPCPDGTSDCLGGTLSTSGLLQLSLAGQQQALQQQQLADQLQVATENANTAQIAATGTAAANYLTAQGAEAQALGTAYATTVAAQAALPAAAISAGEGVTATALQSGANIVAQGLSAQGSAISGYENLIGQIAGNTANLVGNQAAASAAQTRATSPLQLLGAFMGGGNNRGTVTPFYYNNYNPGNATLATSTGTL